MNAAKITRDSKSNLALAFVALGRERRDDITIFYAFCRVIDDIADSTEATFETKAHELRSWRKWIRESAADEPEVARDVRGLYSKYAITPAMLGLILRARRLRSRPVANSLRQQLPLLGAEDLLRRYHRLRRKALGVSS